mmetsp:Transcript_15108/g.44532  ORF Transcript_15108/g.44532 Transcript_15108/m.44532 type:complete len:217 (-) Transcript_15108:356-1006(-)
MRVDRLGSTSAAAPNGPPRQQAATQAPTQRWLLRRRAQAVDQCPARHLRASRSWTVPPQLPPHQARPRSRLPPQPLLTTPRRSHAPSARLQRTSSAGRCPVWTRRLEGRRYGSPCRTQPPPRWQRPRRPLRCSACRPAAAAACWRRRCRVGSKTRRCGRLKVWAAARLHQGAPPQRRRPPSWRLGRPRWRRRRRRPPRPRILRSSAARPKLSGSCR